MGKGKPSVPKAIFCDLSPASRGVKAPCRENPSSNARKFRGVRDGLMQKRKPLASNVALLAAVVLSGSSLAFADKGGKGPGQSAAPSTNLGLAGIPKVGVGLSVTGPVTIPPGTVRSTSLADLTPTGDNHPPGMRSGRGRDGGDTPGKGHESNRSHGGNDPMIPRAPERVASAEASSNETAENRADQLPTCP